MALGNMMTDALQTVKQSAQDAYEAPDFSTFAPHVQDVIKTILAHKGIIPGTAPGTVEAIAQYSGDGAGSGGISGVSSPMSALSMTKELGDKSILKPAATAAGTPQGPPTKFEDHPPHVQDAIRTAAQAMGLVGGPAASAGVGAALPTIMGGGPGAAAPPTGAPPSGGPSPASILGGPQPTGNVLDTVQPNLKIGKRVDPDSGAVAPPDAPPKLSDTETHIDNYQKALDQNQQVYGHDLSVYEKAAEALINDPKTGKPWRLPDTVTAQKFIGGKANTTRDIATLVLGLIAATSGKNGQAFAAGLISGSLENKEKMAAQMNEQNQRAFQFETQQRAQVAENALKKLGIDEKEQDRLRIELDKLTTKHETDQRQGSEKWAGIIQKAKTEDEAKGYARIARQNGYDAPTDKEISADWKEKNRRMKVREDEVASRHTARDRAAADTMGRLALSQGDPNLAVQILRAAATASPDKAAVYNKMADDIASGKTQLSKTVSASERDAARQHAELLRVATVKLADLRARYTVPGMDQGYYDQVSDAMARAEQSLDELVQTAPASVSFDPSGQPVVKTGGPPTPGSGGPPPRSSGKGGLNGDIGGKLPSKRAKIESGPLKPIYDDWKKAHTGISNSDDAIAKKEAEIAALKKKQAEYDVKVKSDDPSEKGEADWNKLLKLKEQGIKRPNSEKAENELEGLKAERAKKVEAASAAYDRLKAAGYDMTGVDRPGTTSGDPKPRGSAARTAKLARGAKKMDVATAKQHYASAKRHAEQYPMYKKEYIKEFEKETGWGWTEPWPK